MCVCVCVHSTQNRKSNQSKPTKQWAHQKKNVKRKQNDQPPQWLRLQTMCAIVFLGKCRVQWKIERTVFVFGSTCNAQRYEWTRDRRRFNTTDWGIVLRTKMVWCEKCWSYSKRNRPRVVWDRMDSAEARLLQLCNQQPVRKNPKKIDHTGKNNDDDANP